MFVPIVIGSIEIDKAKKIAQELKDYFLDERTLFCVSSDFCHWGSRFAYQPYSDKSKPIFHNIETLDREGMSIIETHNIEAFYEYRE